MSKEMKKCLQCGNCCRETIIDDVSELDLWREPALAHILFECRGEPGRFMIHSPCKLQQGNNCSIYPTRPNICVSHVPGTHDCCPQYDPDDQEYLDRFTGE